jgi:hypothetical protein
VNNGIFFLLNHFWVFLGVNWLTKLSCEQWNSSLHTKKLPSTVWTTSSNNNKNTTQTHYHLNQIRLPSVTSLFTDPLRGLKIIWPAFETHIGKMDAGNQWKLKFFSPSTTQPLHSAGERPSSPCRNWTCTSLYLVAMKLFEQEPLQKSSSMDAPWRPRSSSPLAKISPPWCPLAPPRWTPRSSIRFSSSPDQNLDRMSLSHHGCNSSSGSSALWERRDGVPRADLLLGGGGGGGAWGGG